MKKDVARLVLAAALFVTIAAGSLVAVVAAPPNSCEAQCDQQYRDCQRICSKNPCFVSCETVLEICLSNCGGGGGETS